MTPVELRSLADPSELPLPLQALWHEAKGDWATAHELAQQAGSSEGDWVHAYLHRREGDDGNAAYWYAKARRRPATDGLDREWEEIAAALLT